MSSMTDHPMKEGLLALAERCEKAAGTDGEFGRSLPQSYRKGDLSMEMQQHFVTFYSPGTFVAETTTKPIDSWDVDAARAMAAEISERYGAKPYGFRFTTRGREADELDSKEIAKSPMHYIGGKVETIEEVFLRNDPKESILRSNMECNGYKRIWTSTDGWRWTQPLNKDDVVLKSASA